MGLLFNLLKLLIKLFFIVGVLFFSFLIYCFLKLNNIMPMFRFRFVNNGIDLVCHNLNTIFNSFHLFFLLFSETQWIKLSCSILLLFVIVCHVNKLASVLPISAIQNLPFDVVSAHFFKY